MKKILLMSQFTPPVLEGIAIMLYNLFKFFPPSSVCMLTDDPSKRREKKDENMRLPFRHYIARIPNFSFWFARSPNFKALLQYCWLPVILFQGIRILKKEKIDVIFGVNSKGSYLVASYYLHKITGKSFFVYMFDLWSEILTNPFQSQMAKKYEKKILRSAKKVFVMSENLADYYKRRYSIESEVIPHSYIKEKIEKTDGRDFNGEEKKFFDIVFTGIVDLKHTWLQMLREVLKDISGERIKLRLCVPRLDFVKGVESKNIIAESLNRNEVILAQKKADVLFLPMYLREDCKREVLKTASPSKLGEYLFSGVPILVFAPKYSYISEYATREKWALVVNELDKDKLKEAIVKLKNEPDLRQNLVFNALRVAKKHDAQLISKKIQEYLLFS